MRKNYLVNDSIVCTLFYSFLFTHIDIVILTTNTNFLHRALLFLFVRRKAVLLLQQISQ